MRLVTLVNRTESTLHGVWDGRHHDILPGANTFPELQALAFKRQNPVMGSEDPITGYMDYKVGILEDNDLVEPLKAVKESIERWDRSKLAGARPTEVVAGDNGLYQLGRTAGSQGLPADAGFAKA
jgi:flagellar basal body rod protein FlgF